MVAFLNNTQLHFPKTGRSLFSLLFAFWAYNQNVRCNRWCLSREIRPEYQHNGFDNKFQLTQHFVLREALMELSYLWIFLLLLIWSNFVVRLEIYHRSPKASFLEILIVLQRKIMLCTILEGAFSWWILVANPFSAA